MEANLAYNFAQRNVASETPSVDNAYELVDIQTTREMSTRENDTAESQNDEKQSQGRGTAKLVTTVAVLALMISTATIISTIVLILTYHSNQEIQSLKLENLREMLNQTGDNSNQEIQSLKLELENLKEILNKTNDSQREIFTSSIGE